MVKKSNFQKPFLPFDSRVSGEWPCPGYKNFQKFRRKKFIRSITIYGFYRFGLFVTNILSAKNNLSTNINNKNMRREVLDPQREFWAWAGILLTPVSNIFLYLLSYLSFPYSLLDVFLWFFSLPQLKVLSFKPVFASKPPTKRKRLVFHDSHESGTLIKILKPIESWSRCQKLLNQIIWLLDLRC